MIPGHVLSCPIGLRPVMPEGQVAALPRGKPAPPDSPSCTALPPRAVSASRDQAAFSA